MLTESSYCTLALESGAAISLLRSRGWKITCVTGRIWLTEQNGGADVWLEPGQSFAPTLPGRLVIEADGTTRIRFDPLRSGHSRLAAWISALRGFGQPAWLPVMSART